MKKILFALILGIMTTGIMTSCSNGNTPSAVVKKNIECIQNKDADGIVELTYFEDYAKTPEQLADAKGQLLSIIQNSGFKSMDDIGGIKSFEILSEEIPDNPKPGTVAYVNIKTEYGNGEQKEDKVKVVMDKEGIWKVALAH